MKSAIHVRNEIVDKIYEIKLTLQQEEQPEQITTNDDETEENDFTLLFLEDEFERRGLTRLDQLPLKGVESIVDFVNTFPANSGLFAILQKLQATDYLKFPISESSISKIKLAVFQPKFYCPFLCGTGYYSLTDQLTHRVAALDLGCEQYPSIIGFALPELLVCKRIGQIFNICKIFRNSNEFLQARQVELQLPSGIIGANEPNKPFQSEPKHGYNVSHKKKYADIAFTFVREYRQFSLVLQNSLSTGKPQLSLDFLNRVKEICRYQLEDYFGEKQWQHFFTFYGTHVVTSANGGGKLVLTISETQLKQYFKSDNLVKKQAEIEQLFSNYLDLDEKEFNQLYSNLSIDTKVQIEENLFETLCINSIKLHGGDSTFEGIDLIKSTKSREELRHVLQDWVKSIQYHPVMLDTSLTIESIPDILDCYGLVSEAYLIDNAARHLFGKSLRMKSLHIPPPASDGELSDRFLSSSRRRSNFVLPFT